MMRANEIKSKKMQEKEKLNDEVCLPWESVCCEL